MAGLSRAHIFRLDTIVEVERPLELFARLNIRHGPNTEQIVREIPKWEEQSTVEFDLNYSSLNEKRVEHAWLDLIFEEHRRDLNVDTCAVAGFTIRVYGPSVPDGLKRINAVLDDLS